MGLAAALFLIVATPTALAHDPGQGESAYAADLTAERDADHWTIRATIDASDCAAIHADRLVARRAGREVEGHLEEARPCTYRGEIELPETGRWFAYVELTDARGPLEAWIPLEPEGLDAKKATEFYRPPTNAATTSQIISGVLLYAASLALVALLVSSHHTKDRST